MADAIMAHFETLSSSPASIADIEEDLAFNLSHFCEGMVRSGRKQEAIWLFRRAVDLSRAQSKYVLHSFSSFLSKNGFSLLEAISALQKCVEIDPSFFVAYESLENVKSLIVDRWHFRMLNDHHRNRAYQRAIERAVAKYPNCTVLDIGGGEKQR